MDIARRTFLAGSAAAAGLAATLATRASAQSTPSPAALFGPPEGQALLSRNENPYGPAPSALQAIAEASSNGCYYADRGLARLGEMIAERNGVSPSQVVVGAGSTEILSAISLAWGAKGAILCPGLFWDATVRYGERQGVDVIRVPLDSEMQVDIAGIEAAFGENVSLVQICNPNNPTGMLVDGAALRRLAAQVTPTATLLVDEAYNELTDDPEGNSVLELVKAGQDVIVCRTFSKIYGMAGMRVGYAITSEENAALIRSHQMSFGGNVAGLAGAIASYNDTGFLAFSKERVTEGREMIYDAIARSGLTALPSQTNFVYVVVEDADAVQAAMANRGVMIRGAYGPWTQFSRVSCGRLEDVARYAAALPEVIGEVQG
ncbi:pyridoxal phosphate-dependent aminotransferase [Alteraurantiacibacter aquimixticola]|uniref:Histidinol-phosphate aminotransferase family protein n=1 Tax=Alteraurantiacibacter aquimixticola TaxID=2489173 RepID=A0A4T3F1D9_9SPHN|nr:histidinol-phosphate transaminase [Alteraurantiacibacter aquimixticola]TIX51003.1 histidinol-phosphate aminotransferase family protein [Alteraurantiacibacter aquimixticola]